MKRLYFILGIGHLVIVASAILFYTDPSIWAALVGGLGAFVRMMVPYPRKPAEVLPRRILSSFQILGWIILYVWLSDLGLSEFLKKAEFARFSATPLVACGLILGCLLLKDWLWLRHLSQDEIENFYKQKAQPSAGGNAASPRASA
jgi:hypothetical protein